MGPNLGLHRSLRPAPAPTPSDPWGPCPAVGWRESAWPPGAAASDQALAFAAGAHSVLCPPAGGPSLVPALPQPCASSVPCPSLLSAHDAFVFTRLLLSRPREGALLLAAGSQNRVSVLQLLSKVSASSESSVSPHDLRPQFLDPTLSLTTAPGAAAGGPQLGRGQVGGD